MMPGRRPHPERSLGNPGAPGLFDVLWAGCVAVCDIPFFLSSFGLFMRWLTRLFVLVLLLSVMAAVAAGVWWWRWPQQPVALQADTVAFEVKPGASGRQVAGVLHRAGVGLSPEAVALWLRLSGQAQRIKAGHYEIEAGDTAARVLDKLVRGEQALVSVTLIEGWNLHQVVAALSASPHLRNDLQGVPPAQWPGKLGLAVPHLEGRLLPDTYRVAKGATVSSVVRAAASAMDRELAQVWAQRAPDTPLRSAEEALILASIVEKETGVASDRPLVAGVFVNRLRIGMRLQTDPTVIYGLGERFDGDLRKRDLLADTPYNTYTRAGLPPTPIAMPGKAALLAAVQPARTPALYFVARGDGSSQFSATLEEHNRAIDKYIRGR